MVKNAVKSLTSPESIGNYVEAIRGAYDALGMATDLIGKIGADAVIPAPIDMGLKVLNFACELVEKLPSE